MSANTNYLIAIATGLTPEQAKLYAAAMTHSNAPSIDYLRVTR